ncbi:MULTISPECIES: SDR family oxidoreductase [Micromonospora]|uniref:SDR family oxidoreductase n=1 Tax=Micromonospora TaxID=1873 RepID=UPI001EE9766E|nr:MULTISPECIES: SDR family oxidoreductase [Micromonospora]MCG5449724.1 SDR family oxidoreductase [Micromonospora hortensis]MCX5121870.1 SDR family oxidoreductase [Micromonospora sp. NBC_00362]
MMLQDKVAVVAGVGPGLGRAIALACARAGADVVLAARNESVLAEVAKEVEQLGRRALAAPTDLTDDAAVAALADSALRAFGRVDVLVYNAFAVPTFTDLTAIDVDAVRASLETDVFGALRVTQRLAPTLTEHNGAIVMINAMVVRQSKPSFGAYRMSKAGLLALAQSLSTELGPSGVRVNTVMPNYVWSDGLRGYFAYLAQERGITEKQVYDETAASLDLRRLPEADEVANAVVFLASDLASAITGQCLDVNAGELHR